MCFRWHGEHSILNKMFHSSDVLKALGIIFSLEDPNKPRTCLGSHRWLIFFFLNTFLTWELTPELQQLDVAQKIKKASSTQPVRLGKIKQKHLWVLLPQTGNLWERNHKIDFPVMQKDEMTHKFTVVQIKLYFKALKMRCIHVTPWEMDSLFRLQVA